MTVKRSSLGRNLSALLSQSTNVLLSEKPQAERLMLAVDCLQPGKYQPRGEMEETPLQELAQSIKKQGLLQPLLVRELSDGRYEIIAGERRWRASQMAGLTEIPVILKQVDDETAMAMALVENLQREDLNAMDQARAMQRLINEFSLTHQQVAELLCKSRTAVSNYIRLLALSNPVKKLLEHGDIDMGHARALLILEEEQQNQVAQLIVAKNLSVRETEKLVERIKTGKNDIDSNQAKDINPSLLYHDQLKNISRHLQAAIKLKPGKAGKGSLVIHYDNQHSLQTIIEQLTKGVY
ncbi:ParB/RepB/Spo0J family partition protein [Legionella longbeachae]|uniref:Probable chromosome-partitioning protein ParB n=1 Tax=Legionella longbeachae serogroup 1 (strain NSW150) TaxID=661367 RepID=D3HNM2_LEGLN|nr:ParB/RepB/Spo0J family partition protein [Legionella longbeachae]VEE01011.1 chromosome partitioning protein parB [Legionella oakridgensis]HBD7399252.1 ParB/RepB/Spo0J family partition protein [Legionella pneumophila]ARB92607.1 ParB/RepB/Spo0J family partition protein [Legionella longbeachae]ARM34217.1 ParB/RepB/Spo0J family partition protein [Legionella longbeachae]EEZ96522.1 chromosome partitioning protein ParB [Legionella longbeachae D-4968]